MKIVKTFTLMSIAALAMTSCGKNETVRTYGTASEPAFKAAITRMADNKWADGDNVGIFMIQNEESRKANALYTVSAAGELTAKTENDIIKYPADKSAVNFKAYYPFTAAAAGGEYAVDLADQSDLRKIDLIYSDNATGKKHGEKFVTLNFKHKLSKVNFSVTDDTNVEDFKLQLKGITDGTFNLLKGQMTNGTTETTFPLNVTEGTTNYTMLIPATKPVLMVTVGQTTKEYPVKNALVAGDAITIPVTIKGEETQPEDFTVTFVNPVITDWNKTSSDEAINADFNDKEEEEVTPEPEPTPEPGKPEYETTVIVDENLATGNGALTSKGDDKSLTAGINNVTITKISGRPEIRYRATYGACLWLNNAEVSISGLDLKNCKNAKLILGLEAAQGGAQAIVKFNDKEFNIDDLDTNTLKEITVTLSEEPIEEGTSFSIEGIQLRVKTIKITAEKQKV